MLNGKANFSVFSSQAEKVVLGLFENGALLQEVEMSRSNDVWHIGIEDLPKDLSYAYRCFGPKELFFNPDLWLIDPYAKRIEKGKALAKLPEDFDWEGDYPPNIAHSDLIIYEMHVRGFTKHSSSQTEHPGTYLGVVEKIPYLKKVGVNALELLPIYQFDPSSTKNIDPKTGEKLVNYWGYNPLHFFVPMDWYAEKDALFEFKTMVKELHKEGIEVILDVVYNHTGEGEHALDSVHFRGLDHSVYYMVDAQGNDLNYSGCGNTFNANHPIVMDLILDSLRYWVSEMHVDGFRFDLASILTRAQNGTVLEKPPILEAIAKDSVLSKAKLIAEAWDAAGLYQVGKFPSWGRWSEWNGRYRDIVRRFIKGTDGKAGVFASAICGSEMIYHYSKTPLSSVNFITAHDGFTLRDLVTYDNKHNERNGEENRDGNDHNDSWNCGVEGPTQDANIIELRERQMRNFLVALFCSQGIPMLVMGDEYGHSREGNNNPYVQDNELNWMIWEEPLSKRTLFVSSLIAFRKSHPSLRRTQFLTDADITWFSDWGGHSRSVSFMLKQEPQLFFAYNANFEPIHLDLPEGEWKVIVNTVEDWLFHEEGPSISSVELAPYSALVLRKFS